jgi:cyclic pyranopterin phosphate synthase
MPTKDFDWIPKENLMSYEELFDFIKIMIKKGVNKIRITGGEPTLREDLHKLISMIYNYKQDIDLAMTTNGYFMNKQAKILKDAGLKRVNISLDSLQTKIAYKLAQKDILSNVKLGIEQSINVGLKVKLNSVIIKGINDQEIVRLLEYAKYKNVPIRFIEYMENASSCNDMKGLSSEDILANISKKYNFKESPKDIDSPAKYFRLDDGYEFGIIEPHKDDFCKSCNKLRLTAEGDLIPCLYFDEALSIKNQNRDKINTILQNLMDTKPEKNRWDEDGSISNRKFFETGG